MHGIFENQTVSALGCTEGCRGLNHAAATHLRKPSGCKNCCTNMMTGMAALCDVGDLVFSGWDALTAGALIRPLTAACAQVD
mgnify:CR=1 FL=1